MNFAIAKLAIISTLALSACVPDTPIRPTERPGSNMAAAFSDLCLPYASHRNKAKVFNDAKGYGVRLSRLESEDDPMRLQVGVSTTKQITVQINQSRHDGACIVTSRAAQNDPAAMATEFAAIVRGFATANRAKAQKYGDTYLVHVNSNIFTFTHDHTGGEAFVLEISH